MSVGSDVEVCVDGLGVCEGVVEMGVVLNWDVVSDVVFEVELCFRFVSFCFLILILISIYLVVM